MMDEHQNLIYDMNGKEIGAWDGERIEDLRIFIMMAPGIVDFSALPHDDQVPESIFSGAKLPFPVIACDRRGYCLVGDAGDSILSLSLIYSMARMLEE